MLSNKFLGWGSIIIGSSLLCAGAYELLSGNYAPSGNKTGSKELFSLLFSANGPHIHSLIWLFLGGSFIWLGISILKDFRTKNNHKKYTGQKSIKRK